MLITGTTGNYAATGGVADAALKPADLDKGSVGIYGVDKTTNRDVLISASATATGKVTAADYKGKTIKICEGLGGGKFKTSGFFDVKGIHDLNLSVYKAPVPWKAYIGNNGTDGSIVIGTLNPTRNEVIIELRERYSNNERGMPYFFEFQLAATGETIATVLTKIKAALDAGVEGEVPFTTVINGGNTGLSLTDKLNYRSWELSIRGAIETSTVTVVGREDGSGNYENLKRYEILSQAKRGNLYTLNREWKEVPSSLVEATTYDTFVLNGINREVAGGYGGAGLAGNPTVGTSVEAWIVFPSATSDNKTDFVAVMDALLGVENEV